MTGFAWLFLYSPIPYLAAMYFAAYRHDLGRIAHPFRDHSNPTEWHTVCKELGLTSADIKDPGGRAFGGRRNLALVFASLGIYVFAVSFPLPSWYYLSAMQAVVALLLFITVVLNWTGPLPFRPYRDVLPYPRLGTRVRHVGGGRIDAKKRIAEPPISTTGGGRK